MAIIARVTTRNNVARMASRIANLRARAAASLLDLFAHRNNARLACAWHQHHKRSIILV